MAASPPLIHVILAVYQPDMAALERQVASVLAQSGCTVCLHLFADGPMPQLPLMASLVSRDPKMEMVTFADNRGPATTFLEGLAHVAAKSSGLCWFAYCDQDDVWAQDKLSTSLARLEQCGVACVHSDARVTDVVMNEIAPSLFALEKRAHAPSLAALFFRNNATGMTMLFTRELALAVVAHRHLRPKRWLHDHFTAFLAACRQGLAFEERPLADYVQHGGNAVGAGKRLSGLPTGGFFHKGGDAAQWHASGLALLRAVLDDNATAKEMKPEISRLRRALSERSLAATAQLWAMLRAGARIPRDLLARLLWAKLTG